jgi:hypothetical protein
MYIGYLRAGTQRGIDAGRVSIYIKANIRGGQRMGKRPDSPSVALLALLLITIPALGFPAGGKRPPGVFGNDPDSPRKRVRCDSPDGCEGTMTAEDQHYVCNKCARRVLIADYSSSPGAE